MDEIKDQQSSLKSFWIIAWVVFGVTEIVAAVAPWGPLRIEALGGRIAIILFPICAAVIAVKTNSMVLGLHSGSLGEVAIARRISFQLVAGFVVTCAAVIICMTFLTAR